MAEGEKIETVQTLHQLEENRTNVLFLPPPTVYEAARYQFQSHTFVFYIQGVEQSAWLKDKGDVCDKSAPVIL